MAGEYNPYLNHIVDKSGEVYYFPITKPRTSLNPDLDDLKKIVNKLDSNKPISVDTLLKINKITNSLMKNSVVKT